MARLNDITRDQLAPDHQEFFDSIASSRGSVRGPYGVLLHSPDLAARVAHTGTYVRFELDITEAQREIIICATAREIRQQYEFSAHARLARQAGVSEDVVSAIATGKAPEGMTGIEASAGQVRAGAGAEPQDQRRNVQRGARPLRHAENRGNHRPDWTLHAGGTDTVRV